MWSNNLTNSIHKLYRKDPWVQSLYQTAGHKLDEIETGIREWHENRFFDGYTFALPIWERILGVRPGRAQGDDSRRAALRAKWLSNRKSDRALLQAIADGWKPDALRVGFDDGYITLTADGAILQDWRYLIRAIEEAKPAHLPIVPVIRTRSMLYFGGTLVPSYTHTELPQWAPVRTLHTSATGGGMVSSTTTTNLPPLEVN